MEHQRMYNSLGMALCQLKDPFIPSIDEVLLVGLKMVTNARGSISKPNRKELDDQ